MEKNKYQRSTREEKKKAREALFKTEYGIDLKKRLNRLVIYSILLILCVIYLVIDNILGENTISIYIFAGFLLLFAIIFLIGRHYVIIKSTNSYMIKNKGKK